MDCSKEELMAGKTEIVDSVAERTGVKKADVSKVLDETLGAIKCIRR